MTQQTTLKHKLPNGRIAKRRTPRAYTHVVIGEHDAEQARRSFESNKARMTEIYGSNFDYYTVQSGPNAQVYAYSGRDLAQENANALEILAGRSREKFIADEIENDRVRMEEDNVRRAGTHLLRWSQSLSAAWKGADYFGKYSYSNIRVEPVNGGSRD